MVDLDAGGTTDPDGDGLGFAWGVDPAEPDVAGQVVIEGRDSPRARVVVPQGMAVQTISILLAITDGGNLRLTRYGRVLIRVERLD
jgi:hypothetical protein